MTSSGGAEEFVNSRGIWIEDSGTDANVIMHNTFDQLEVAQVAIGDNRNEDDRIEGLSYNCNTYTNNEYDHLVTQGRGIGFFQGNDGNAAGNTLSHRGETSDFTNGIHGEFIGNITYYEKFNSGSEELLFYTTNTISKITTDQGSCSMIDEDDCRDRYLFLLEEYQKKLRKIKDLEDGGKKQELITKIENVTETSANSVQKDLLNESPYLSNDVLKKVVDKSEIFKADKAREILKKNPDKIRKNKIEEYVVRVGKAGYLDYPEIKSDVKGDETELTTLELELNQFATELAIVKDCYEKEVLLNGAELDVNAWLNFLSEQPYRRSRIKEIETRISMKNYGVAENELEKYRIYYGDQIAANYDLQKEVEWLDEIINIKSSNANYNDLSQSQYDLIKAHADLFTGSSSLKAQNILNYFYDRDYNSDRVIDLSSSQNKVSSDLITQRLAQAPELDDSEIMTLFPNPVSTWIGLRIDSGLDDLYEMRIYNLTGKLILSRSGLSSGEHTLPLDGDIPTGIYLISLYQDGQKIQACTFAKL